MCVKQNASDFAHKYPIAAKVVDELFYVDCLTGANSVEEVIELESAAESILRSWFSLAEVEFK